MPIGKTNFASASAKTPIKTSTAFTFDPSIKQMVDVTLDEIKIYEKNPRSITRNPAFEDIKSSIAARGLENPLKLTKRNSDDSHFILSDGGGTRYAALVELWEETGDVKYFNHKFPYEPFISELDLLIRHASENGNRGAMSWIENALQAELIASTIKENEGRGDIPFRELAEKITALGLSTNPGRLTEYRYTVVTLNETIPKALKAGMGRPKVNDIKTIDKKYSAWCKKTDSLDDRDYSLALRQALTQSDLTNESDVFNVSKMETLLVDAIAVKAGIDKSEVLKEEKTKPEPGATSDSSVTPIRDDASDTSLQSDTSDNNRNGSDSREPITDSESLGSQESTKVISSNRPVALPAPNELSPGERSARLVSRSIKARAIASDLQKKCSKLGMYFMEVGDEQTPVALGFAVDAISNGVEDFQGIGNLEILIYCKLHQWFVLSFDQQQQAGLLDDYELIDEVKESCRDNAIESVFWTQRTLLSATAYYDSLKIRSGLQGKANDLDADETFAIDSLTKIETLLAEQFLDLCTL